MNKYDLSLGVIFYRDPIDAWYYDIHEIFDFDKNALNFRNFVGNISASGGGDGPEDWAGGFEMTKNLSWGNDSVKFIVHIADAPAHGEDWVGGSDSYPSEGNRTDQVIEYFAQNNFSIAGFMVDYYQYPLPSFRRAQNIYRNNGNLKYFKKYFSTYDPYEDYFLNLVYESFQYVSNTGMFLGIDVSEELGDIDWKKVKENNKVDFTLIRVGTGNDTDVKFEENYKGAKNSGIPLGVYWVSKAGDKNEAEIECEKFKDNLKGKTIEFPIYYVTEEEEFYSRKNEILSVFDDTFNSTDYLTGLRNKEEGIQDYSNFEEFDDYQLWMSNVTEGFPDVIVDTSVWNYNNTGIIDGIKGNVSLVKSILNYTQITLDNNYNIF